MIACDGPMEGFSLVLKHLRSVLIRRMLYQPAAVGIGTCDRASRLTPFDRVEVLKIASKNKKIQLY